MATWQLDSWKDKTNAVMPFTLIHTLKWMAGMFQLATRVSQILRAASAHAGRFGAGCKPGRLLN